MVKSINRNDKINKYLSNKYSKSKKNVKNKYNTLKKQQQKECYIINVHNEKVVLPKKYPGKLYMHIFFNPDRHYPIDAFEDNYFNDLYKKYRIKCYGK